MMNCTRSRVCYNRKKNLCSMIDKVFLFSFILSLAASLSLPPAALSPPLCVNAVNVHSIIEIVCACSRIQILGGSFG